jgi:hypothetical protein
LTGVAIGEEVAVNVKRHLDGLDALRVHAVLDPEGSAGVPQAQPRVTRFFIAIPDLIGRSIVCYPKALPGSPNSETKYCDLGHKSLKTLERVKGIEPSYSAWKSRNTVVFSSAVLTFSVFLAH